MKKTDSKTTSTNFDADTLRSRASHESRLRFPPPQQEFMDVIKSDITDNGEVIKRVVEQPYQNPNDGLSADDFRLDVLLACNATDFLQKPPYNPIINSFALSDKVNVLE